MQKDIHMKTIAYYPYTTSENFYNGMIRSIINDSCEVIDYQDLKINDSINADALYLNWIEDSLTDEDRSLITKYHDSGKEIIWIFHNKLSHNRLNGMKSYENICYMAKMAIHIGILSFKSEQILYEYVPEIKELGKTFFCPHPNYIGNYGRLENRTVLESLADKKIVFGSIGILREDKNSDLLIEAFQKFSHKNDCALLLAGKPENSAYYSKLKGLADDCDNIIFVPEMVKDYMMDFYVQSCDVIMMPYDHDTCMNSGVMLLAFSNKRTVITSDICMAYDYDNELIYRYGYSNHEDHLNMILEMFEKAYEDGKATLREKGQKLYEHVLEHNSKKVLRDALYSALKLNVSDEFHRRDQIEKNKWRLRYNMADAWLMDKCNGNEFVNVLHDNKERKIAVYGYGKYGKLLVKEMLDNDVTPTCIIDRGLISNEYDIPVCNLDNVPADVEYIIVTTAMVSISYVREKMRTVNKDCYVFGLNDI